MIGLYIFLALLVLSILFIVALFYIPVDISVLYDEEVSIKANLLFFSYSIYPQKKSKNIKKKKKTAKKIPPQKATKEQSAEQSEEKKDFFEMLSFYKGLLENVLLPAIDTLGNHLVIKVKRLHVDIATGDAAKTAIIYGAACNGINALLTALAQYCTLKISKSDQVGVFCRYDLFQTQASGEVVFTLRILHAIKILIPALMKYIAEREKLNAPDPAENKQKQTERNLSHV